MNSRTDNESHVIVWGSAALRVPLHEALDSRGCLPRPPPHRGGCPPPPPPGPALPLAPRPLVTDLWPPLQPPFPFTPFCSCLQPSPDPRPLWPVSASRFAFLLCLALPPILGAQLPSSSPSMAPQCFHIDLTVSEATVDPGTLALCSRIFHHSIPQSQPLPLVSNLQKLFPLLPGTRPLHYPLWPGRL